MRQPESILVVSPDTTTSQGLSRALMNSGLPVTSALEWQEGESRLQRIPVSLVVLDLEQLASEELVMLRRLREDFPHVRVVALVSLATPEGRIATSEGLVLAVLQKPIALGQLDEIVVSALDGKVGP